MSRRTRLETVELGPGLYVQAQEPGSTHPSGARAFLGIPYTQGPPDRWAVARPVSYAGRDDASRRAPRILNSGSLGPMCPQLCKDAYSCSTSMPVDEDCLVLHVWTPGSVAPRARNASTLPVLVFVHGGSFLTGAGGVPVLDGGALAQALGAIVVMLNYRLGILGFLDVSALTGGPLAAGQGTPNVGWEDQALAMQWVHQHVGAFGGDAGRITLMGHSAGALSALWLTRHPALQLNGGRSMIARLLLQSPPALGGKSVTASRQLADQLARQLACPDVQQWACMVNRTSHELLAAYDALQRQQEGALLATDLLPVQLPGEPGPWDVLRNTSLPLLMGGTAYETYFSWHIAHPGPMTGAAFRVTLNALFPNAHDVLRAYAPTWGWKGTLTDYKPLLSRITTDYLFTCPAQRALRDKAPAPPVYRYVLHSAWSGGEHDALGAFCGEYACHSQDLLLLMLEPAGGPLKRLAQSFRDRVAAFLAHGSPNPDARKGRGNLSLPARPGLSQGAPTWRTSTRLDPLLWDMRQEEEAGPEGIALSDSHVAPCAFWDAQGYGPLESLEEAGRPQATTFPTLRVGTQVGLGLLLLLVLLLEACLLLGWWHRRRALQRGFAALAPDLPDLPGVGTGPKHAKHPPASKDPLPTSPGALAQLLDHHPQPLLLETRRLELEVDEGIPILTDVSVSFLPGTLTALMGSSGAGKSTLLALLSRTHRRPGKASEHIYLGGKQYTSYSRQRHAELVGYVAQYDAVYEGLTCREVLLFSALLKLENVHPDQVCRRVAFLLRLLHLEECADTLIAKPEDQVGGISGGQYRRLSIAVALVSMPSILLLDEPTSGLDAKSAMDLMAVLAELAAGGFTLVCTIHAPRPEIFARFQQVVVLNHGHVLYVGRPGRPALQHLEAVRAWLHPSPPPPTSSSEVPGPRSKAESGSDTITLDMVTRQHAAYRVPTHIPMTTRLASPDIVNAADRLLDLAGAISRAEMQGLRRAGIRPAPPQAWGDLYTDLPLGDASKDLPAVLTSWPMAGTVSSTSLSQQPNTPVARVLVLHAQFWCKRPRLLKLSTLVVAACCVWALAVLQRREGQDAIALGLQIKGLLLCCFGLTALKNIAISFDYYENWDLFGAGGTGTAGGGRGGVALYFLHRLMYESLLSLLEAGTAIVLVYFILGLPPGQAWTCVLLFTAYYTCVSAMYALVYASALSRTEARSVSFSLQAVIALFSGVWVQEGDNAAYSALRWLQYGNPAYWTMSTLVRSALSGTGACILRTSAGVCRATTADSMLMGARLLWIPPATAFTALLGIWVVVRVVQYGLMVRNVCHPCCTLGHAMGRGKRLWRSLRRPLSQD